VSTPEKNDKALLRRYHEHGDLAAREQLIEQYMSLVRSLARRYAYRGERSVPVFDWWTLFARLIDPDHHREAIAMRPLLLTATGC